MHLQRNIFFFKWLTVSLKTANLTIFLFLIVKILCILANYFNLDMDTLYVKYLETSKYFQVRIWSLKHAEKYVKMHSKSRTLKRYKTHLGPVKVSNLLQNFFLGASAWSNPTCNLRYPAAVQEVYLRRRDELAQIRVYPQT